MMQQPLLIVKFSLLVAASAPVLLAAAAGDYSLTDEICDENPPESIPNRNDSYKADALCGTHRQIHRIAGGFSARIGHFPSFVQLHFYHRGQKLPTQCGGTIVGSDLVLTAAHCVGDARTITRIRAIAGSVFRDFGGRIVDFEKFCLPKVWVRGEGVIMPFDIALVIVKEPFRFDDFVQPACYPTVDVDNSYQAFAVGFGYTNPEGSPTRVQPDLLQALPVVRQANCSIFHPPVPKGSVCYKANLPQYSGSTCKGECLILDYSESDNNKCRS